MKQPKVELLESEQIELTTPTVEDLRHLVRMKKKADDILLDEEKSDKENSKALDDIISNKDDKTGTSADSSTGDSSAGSFFNSFFGSDNEPTNSSPNTDHETKNASSAQAKPTDELDASNKKDDGVFNDKEKNPNEDLIYEDKFRNAEQNEKKETQPKSTGDANDGGHSTDHKSTDNTSTDHKSTDNSQQQHHSSESAVEQSSSETSSTTASSKIIDTLKATGSKDTRNDRKINEINRLQTHNETAGDHPHSNGTHTSAAFTHQPTIFSLIISLAIIWFLF